MNRHDFLSFKGITAILILGTVLIHWYAYGKGLLLTDDSYHYLHACNSLIQNHSLIDNNGHMFLFWPPLFPFFLALTGAHIATWQVWIHLFIICGIGIVFSKIVDRVMEHCFIKICCLMYMLWGVHLLLIATFLWSELLFLLLELLFVLFLIQYQAHRKYVLFAMSIGFLLCMQRNAGIFMVFGASTWLWTIAPSKTDNIIKSVLFFLVTASGGIAWNIYVWFLQPHDHFNVEKPLFQKAFYNIQSLLKAEVRSLMPIDNWTILLALVLLTLLSLFVIKRWHQDKALRFFFIVFIVYLICLIGIVTVNIGGGTILFGQADRLLSVVIPFWTILIFKSMDTFIIYNRHKLFRYVLTGVIMLWMAFPMSRTLKNAYQWHQVNRSYRRR